MKLATIRETDGRERVAVVLDGGHRLLDSGTMHHRFGDMIAFVSRSETLGRFLNPGDVVELEVDRIGVLRNRIIKVT